MKLRQVGVAALLTVALTACAASSASATTFEVGGVTKNESITIKASNEPQTSLVLSRTDGSLANECATSNLHGSTSRFTTVIDNPGTALEHITEVEGPLTGDTAQEQAEGKTPEGGLNFSNCTRVMTAHRPGTLAISHTSGTDGTVTSKGAEVTVGSPFGTLNCKTGEGVVVGTLKGTASGHATMEISTIISCGFLVPSAFWKGTYVVTSPTGLGVSA